MTSRVCTIILLVAISIAQGVSSEMGSASEEFVDVHMHLNGRSIPDRSGSPQRGRGNPRRPPQRSTPTMDYEAAADHLVEMMDRAGVAKAIVMPPPQELNKTGAYTYHVLLGAIRKHPGRLYLAGGGGELFPLIQGTESAAVTPALRRRFEALCDEMIRDGARSFGEMAILHFSLGENHGFHQTPADHPLFLLLADIAARHNMPIDIHWEAVPQDQPLPQTLASRTANPPTIQATIPGLERLLAHNRNTKIVLVHIGWDNTGHATIPLLKRLLDENPNLTYALKFVRREYEPFQRGNKFADEDLRIRAEWVRFISDYSDRFVVGADEFVGVRRSSERRGPPPSFDDTWNIIHQLPQGVRAKVGRENALRLYGLN